MKKWIAILTSLMLLAVLGGVLPAERVTNKAGGVSLWLPDDWKVDSGSQDGSINAAAPEDDSFFELKVLAADDLDAAKGMYENALADEIDDFSSISGDQKGEINGMKSVAITGEGQRHDTNWSVRVTLLSAGESILLLVMGWEKAKDSTFAPLAGKVVNSVKKLE